MKYPKLPVKYANTLTTAGQFVDFSTALQNFRRENAQKWQSFAMT